MDAAAELAASRSRQAAQSKQPTAPRSRTKDPSYHVFRLTEAGPLTHCTSEGPVKASNVEEAVKKAAGPLRGEKPEEFFVCLADQLKSAKRRPEKTEVFD